MYHKVFQFLVEEFSADFTRWLRGKSIPMIRLQPQELFPDDSAVKHETISEKTCQFLVAEFSADFANWLEGESIVITGLQPQDFPLEPIRAESLILKAVGERSIGHLEFQTQPDQEIPCQMIDYFIRIYGKFPDYEIWQVVIYLVRTESPLVYQTEFSSGRMRHEFEVIRMWEQPLETFLSCPGLLPLAVFSQCENPEMALVEVATAIDKIESVKERANLAAASRILARLVLEEDLIDRVLRRDIIQESAIDQEGCRGESD